MNEQKTDYTDMTYIQNCLEKVEKQCEILDRMRVEAEEKVKEWNKDEEILKLEERIVKLCRKYSEGFVPSEKQWKKIRRWEEKHTNSKHRIKIKPGERRKYVPNAASFSYSFSYTHLGVMGMAICDTCRKEAFKKSLGNKNLYDKIMEEKNAEYFIGEV